MKKVIAVTTGALLSVVLTATSQTINPIQPASGSLPAPTYSATEGLQPLIPGGNVNAGAQVLNSEIGPVQPAGDPIEQDANVELGETTLTPEGQVSDGKALAETSDKLWRLRPLISTGVVYDDNIFISQTNRVSDVIFSVSAGLAFELGDYRKMQDNYLLAEYVGTGFFYAKNTEQNAFNQSAVLRGQYRFSKLVVQLNSRYQYLTGAEREVGDSATRHIFRNSLRFAYEYSDKTTFDLEFLQSANVYQQYLSSYGYAVKAGADYAITPKIALGGEIVGGLLFAQDSSMQSYEQLRLRARYNATGKLSFKTSFGLELRQLEDGVRVSPVFSLGAEYRPFENTLISLVGYGDVQSSSSTAGQDFLATGVELSLRQLLFQSVTVGVAGGYENDTYFSSEDGESTGRRDNYFYLRPNLSYTIVKLVSVGVFYEFRRNDSTSNGNSFYNNRVGVELAARF